MNNNVCDVWDFSPQKGPITLLNTCYMYSIFPIEKSWIYEYANVAYFKG